MTAEPTTAHSSPWPVPPQDGYTVDDLFTLPDLPPHTELIDGSLVFVSPQRKFHSTVIDLLVAGLRSTAPPEMKIRREMTVVLDRRNGPEPDVSVIRSEADSKGMEQTSYAAADVHLAVEVVSPDSEARDREAKPHKYATAGIPHFWLVEMTGTDQHPVVRVYELDPVTKAYALTGIHHDRLKTGVPFPVDIDISADALKEL
ncbi:Uma2 family endonuclease [Streptomyces sp. NPDC012389]|uniref:Uma2 family endonuclease n=1 Tax=unclassified Streptomyces TaxID=2593676 RepID=UPI00081F4B02|nr:MULTISPECIES: Uma2 family endonuclease [unclassified Streptomyces]MYR92057.1 Uma2 family endonuclease [Streptomyces sp. SID4937]MYX14221.1 Uma2 family endonuclease [Streptomyces sp. SID8374]SCD27450.1 Endonuclease, Uma2 family (restriction endonuclease fold) [Streptomyces sp. ScaeMP-e83]